MPQPQPNETRKDFLDRCVPEVIGEGKEPNQAVAQCNSMYDQSKMSSVVEGLKKNLKNG